MSELVRKFHDAMLHKSADELADLYAVDGVHEFPFGGLPPYRGREGIRSGYAAAWGASPAEPKEIRGVVVHSTDSATIVQQEVVVMAHGKEFVVPGLLIIEERDGEIVRTQDYMDATAIAALRAG